MSDLIRTLERLRAARRPLAFSGAGMSAESGVPTFRGARDGLWQAYDPSRLATAAAFRADPDLVWGWYVWRMGLVRQAQPNAGHLALAALQERWPELRVVTQNVDDLHERAGSRGVLHLHGGLFEHRCFDCGRAQPDFEVPADAATSPCLRRAPPRCSGCGGPLRPGVVWFGEALPEAAWSAAVQAIERADLVLVIGTSGVVEPAASLVGLAQRHGARIVEINPEPSAFAAGIDVRWRAPAGVALAQLQAAIGEEG